MPVVFTKKESQDGKTAEPGHVQDSLGCRAARARSAVFQTPLTGVGVACRSDVEPDHAMVSGGNCISSGLAFARPKDGAFADFEAARRQDVVDPQATVVFRGEIGGHLSGLAVVFRKLLGMMLDDRRAALARRCDQGVHSSVL